MDSYHQEIAIGMEDKQMTMELEVGKCYKPITSLMVLYTANLKEGIKSIIYTNSGTKFVYLGYGEYKLFKIKNDAI